MGLDTSVGFLDMPNGVIDMADETDVPGPGLDDLWWRHAANSADVADRERQATEAEDFQAHRRWHYYNTGQERARHHAHDASIFSVTVFNRRRFQ
jgi:hypothetical protein